MIILRVACNNLFMFKNFEVDFTYDRKSNHFLSENDKLFIGSNIRVRKNLIIMGANASGKTTFGKLLCLIFNFIYGNDLSNNSFDFSSAIYDRDEDSNLEVEFVVDGKAYLLRVCFRNNGLWSEEVYKQRIYKYYDIQTLREKLKSNDPITTYKRGKTLFNIGYKSYAFSSEKELIDLRLKIGFLFSFSERPLNSSTYLGELNFKLINDLLPKIDNSVATVNRLIAVGEDTKTPATKSYLIIFNNNESVTVPEGDLSHCDERLSHGTREAIDFLSAFDTLSKRNSFFFYFDERLSHMHSELEAYFIYQAFSRKLPDSQVFFTTHNTELLDLNAPITTFLFFRRNDEGFNEVVYPSKVFRKNIRDLRTHYENDYFGVLPDYSVLDGILEENIHV